MNSFKNNHSLNNPFEIDLKRLFLAAFLFGTLAIVLSSVFNRIPWMHYVGLIVSIMCVVLYSVIGSKQVSLEKSQSIDQVADSSYYLGFLFTLTSLVSALIAVGSDLGAGQQGILSVLSNFALALSTTIVGLMSKILLTQFEPTLQKQKQKAVGDLTKATQQFSKKLKNSTSKVDNYLDAAEAKIQSTNQEAVNQLMKISERHNEELINSIHKLNLEKKALLDNTVEHIQQATETIQDKNNIFDVSLDNLTVNLEKNQVNISNYASRFCESISNTSDSVGKFSNSVDMIGNSLKNQDNHVQQMLTKNAEYVKAIENDMMKLETPYRHIENINASTEKLSTNFEHLQLSLKRSADSAASFADALPSDEKGGALFELLERSVDRHVAAVKGMETACIDLQQIVSRINDQLSDIPDKRAGIFKWNRS